jgi:hypothetical protein
MATRAFRRTNEALGEARLLGLNNLNAVYDHIYGMRVVPFDTRSLLELMAQTLGSLAPLLPYLGVSETNLKLMEGVFKVMGR